MSLSSYHRVHIAKFATQSTAERSALSSEELEDVGEEVEEVGRMVEDGWMVEGDHVVERERVMEGVRGNVSERIRTRT